MNREEGRSAGDMWGMGALTVKNENEVRSDLCGKLGVVSRMSTIEWDSVPLTRWLGE